MSSQFPKIEKIILPESLRGKLDSEPLEELVQSKGINEKHSYLQAVLRTHPEAWAPPLKAENPSWGELRGLAEVEFKFLYEKLLGIEELWVLRQSDSNRAESLLKRRISVMVEGLSEPVDTRVLLDIRLVSHLARHGSSLDEKVKSYEKGAGLFRLYLDETENGFETKKEKIIYIKENFRMNTPSPSGDVAKGVNCSQSYAKKVKPSQSSNRQRLSESERREILERDNRECQVEFSGGKENCSQNFEVHHKDGDRENNDPDNLVTLCEDHHRILENEIQVMCAQLEAERKGKGNVLEGRPKTAGEAKQRAFTFLDGEMKKTRWSDEIRQLTEAFVRGGREEVFSYFQELFGKQPARRYPEHWY